MKYLPAPKKTIQKIKIINFNKILIISPRKTGGQSHAEKRMNAQITVMLGEIENIN